MVGEFPNTEPKSVSNAQKAAITGAGTPYCCCTASNVAWFLAIKARALTTRASVAMRDENCKKLCAKTFCARSRLMMPASYCTLSSWAKATPEMPAAAACFLTCAKKPSKPSALLPQLAAKAEVEAAQNTAKAKAEPHKVIKFSRIKFAKPLVYGTYHQIEQRPNWSRLMVMLGRS